MFKSVREMRGGVQEGGRDERVCSRGGRGERVNGGGGGEGVNGGVLKVLMVCVRGV